MVRADGNNVLCNLSIAGVMSFNVTIAYDMRLVISKTKVRITHPAYYTGTVHTVSYTHLTLPTKRIV